MLRSIDASELTPLDDSKRIAIVGMCISTYIRFGTYGEPSLIPIELVKKIVGVSKTWTGYTHQWSKDWAREYSKYFMASRHEVANASGWRSFLAVQTEQHQVSNAVGCPASKEGGYKSNCASCGLCSGILGKGRKDVKILLH